MRTAMNIQITSEWTLTDSPSSSASRWTQLWKRAYAPSRETVNQFLTPDFPSAVRQSGCEVFQLGFICSITQHI